MPVSSEHVSRVPAIMSETRQAAGQRLRHRATKALFVRRQDEGVGRVIIVRHFIRTNGLAPVFGGPEQAVGQIQYLARFILPIPGIDRRSPQFWRTTGPD